MKRPNGGGEEDELPALPSGRATIQDRIAAFAMLDEMSEKTQGEKIMRLRIVGFTNLEIAAMLQTTPAAVASSVYAERKRVAGVKRPGPKPPTNA
jgi:hypothetical protein